MQPYVTNEQFLDAHTPAPNPSSVPAPDPIGAPAPDPVDAPRLRMFRLSAVLPAIFMTVFGAMGLLLGLAPSMQVNDMLFGSGSAMQSTLYDFGTSSSAAVIGSLVSCTLLAGMGILFAVIPRLKWRRISSKLPLYALLNALSAGACFASFVSTCVMIQEISDTDKSFSGGLGVLTAGAGTICLVVFSLLFLLDTLGVFLWRRYLAKKEPALPAWEKAEATRLAQEYVLPRYADLSDEEKLATRLKRILWFNRIQPWFLAAVVMLFFTGAMIALLSWLEIDQVTILGIISSSVSILLFLIAICRVIFVKKLKQRNGTEIALAKAKKRNLIYSILFGILSLPMIYLLIVCCNTFVNLAIGLPDSYFESFSIDPVFTAYTIIIVLSFFTALCFILSLCAYIDSKRMERSLSIGKASFTVEALNRTKDVKSTFRLKCGSIAGMCSIFLIIFLLFFIPYQTTIFREDKVEAIATGDSEVRVEQVLGKADKVNGSTWLYYTPNYLKYARKTERLEEQYEAALTDGDFEETALIEEKMNALSRDFEENESYYCIRVSFAGGAVRNVEVVHFYFSAGKWRESSYYQLTSNSTSD